MSLSKIKKHFSHNDGDSAQTIAWNTLQTVLTVAKETIDDVPVPGVKAALGGLLVVIDTVQTTKGNLEDIKALTAHIQHIQNDVIDPLKEAISKNAAFMSQSLTRLLDQLEADLQEISQTAQNRLSRGRFQRFVSSSKDVGVIQQMNRDLDRALQAFQAGTIVSVATRAEETHQVVLATQDEVVQARGDIVSTKQDVGMAKEVVLRTEAHAISKAQLDLIMALPRSEEARHDSGSRSAAGAASCFPGTRETTLAKIDTWIENSERDQPFIFWVWGLAGTGKSTIAQTVAERQAARGRLGASFFFSRDRAKQKDPLLLFPSLAFQLAFFDPRFKERLAKGLEHSPNAGYSLIQQQYETLIASPIRTMGDRIGPIVIVIDALDECEPDSEAEKILEVLAADYWTFSGRVKILITSRPEDRIHSKFQSSGLRDYSEPYILHDVSQGSVKEDIMIYLRYHLNQIAARCEVEIPWPKEDILEMLVTRVDAFFIWAATVVKFIGDEAWNDPEYQLRVLLEARGDRALDHVRAVDGLYMTVLRRAMPSDDLALSNRFQTIVGAVVLVRDPMSPDTLEAFLTLSRGTVLRTLKQLHSVLIVPTERDSPIRVFHQSFPDFLTSPERCDSPKFLIDRSNTHERLARLCIKHLSTLRRDICDIKDPGRLHTEVPDFATKVANAVPELLRYSCLHFAPHLFTSDSHDNLFVKFIETFCESKVLAWIETLSCVGRLDAVGPALKDLQAWYRTIPEPKSRVKEILFDAQKLVAQFFHIIRQGAGHICVSALPWAPKSALREVYEKEVPAFYVLMGQEDQWDTSLCVMEGCNVQHERAMALSERGYIVAAIGTSDRDGDNVGIWSAETGIQTALLQTPQRTVFRSVALSGDNKSVVACSNDWTLHTWDINCQSLTSSTRLPEPFNSDGVPSSAFGLIVFSNAGTLLSTGPEGQLYEWNTKEGRLLSTRRGHTKWITTVAASTWHVATGSEDTSVCIWETNNSYGFEQSPYPEETTIPPITLNHPSPLTNIRFIADRDQIITTCSSDNTLRIWNVKSGALERGVELQETVGQIAITPSGMMVLSALRSTRLHVFDAESESHLATLAGHMDHVTSIAVSTGGDEVVSASKDGTMRAWDLNEFKELVTGSYRARIPSPADNTALARPSLSSSGNRLAFALSRTALRVIDLPSGNIVADVSGSEALTMLGLSPDGSYLVACSGFARRNPLPIVLSVWNTNEPSSPKVTILSVGRSSPSQIVFSPEGTLFGVVTYPEGTSSICIMVYVTHSSVNVASITLESTGDIRDMVHATLVSEHRLMCYYDWSVLTWEISDEVGAAYSAYSATVKSLPRPSQAELKSREDYIHVVFELTPGKIAHYWGDTLVYDAETMSELERWSTSSDLYEIRQDGRLAFLVFRDAWLWEINGDGERRLCWIPYKLRRSLRGTQWNGPHLVLTPARGRIVVLDIEALRNHSVSA